MGLGVFPLAVGCDSAKKTAPAPAAAVPGTPAEGPTKPTPPAAAVSSVAKVGTTVITVDHVRGKIGDRTGKSMQPTARLVSVALEALIDEAALVEGARKADFTLPEGAPDQRPFALASAFLADQMNKRPAPGVTEGHLATFFGPRRRSEAILFATRAKASEVQELYRKAVTVTPASADRVFSDFARKVGLKSNAPRRSSLVAYDVAGRAPDGEEVAERSFAGATFALKTVGAVTPPIRLTKGADAGRFALIRLTKIEPAIALADLTDSMRERATTTMLQARRKRAQRSFLDRLRIQVGVEVDAAQVSGLERTITPAAATQLKPPSGGKALRKIDPAQLRVLLKDRRSRTELKPVPKSQDVNSPIYRKLPGKKSLSPAKKPATESAP